MLVGEEDWSSTNTLAKADVEALFALIECAVCVAFLQDAHECTTCHALFCKGCIASWVRTARTCPCCRHASAEADFVPNVVIQRFLDGMSVEVRALGAAPRAARHPPIHHSARTRAAKCAPAAWSLTRMWRRAASAPPACRHNALSCARL